MIGIGIIIGVIIGILLVFGIQRFLDNKDITLDQNFKKSQARVMADLQEKKDSFDKELNNELFNKRLQINTQLTVLKQEQANKEAIYKKQINDLEEAYSQRRAAIAQIEATEDKERIQANQEKINAQAAQYQKALTKLYTDYKEQKDELSKNFFQFSEQINLKRAALTKEIEDYEAKQEEIIARFKADEEKREQADFYRIKVNDIEKKDIQQLKTLALNFSRPESIYKLIYEVYYKAKLEELFKRVLGDNKDKGGIYKITNIRNQKTYIGRSVKYLDRWRTHSKRGCNIERISGQLYDAMWEEGLENFTFEIVEVCPKEEQPEKEKYWIGFYKSDEYGYNGNKGG